MEELLRILEKNARLPVEDIAAMMGKTPVEVAAMMDEAAEKGYIRGLKRSSTGKKPVSIWSKPSLSCMFRRAKSRGFDEIASVVASFDEVDSVLLMSGGYDLQVVIKGRSFQEIAIFVAKRLSRWTMSFPPPPALCCAPTSRRRLYLDEETDDREWTCCDELR